VIETRPVGGRRALGNAPLFGDVQKLVEQRLADGYEILQRGVIARPYKRGAGVTFADQVNDCNVAMILSGDVLLDDGSQWVHLRRRRR
jgi:hypothetical protein